MLDIQRARRALQQPHSYSPAAVARRCAVLTRHQHREDQVNRRPAGHQNDDSSHDGADGTQ